MVAVSVPSGPTPPGWKPDPWGTGKLRWWDGVAWTAHVHPPEVSGSPVATVYRPSPGPRLRDERHAARWAQIALVFAVPAQIAGAIAAAVQVRWLVDHFDELTRNRSRSEALGIQRLGPSGAAAVSQFAQLGLIAAGVLFAVWFYRAALTAEAAGLPARRRPGLAACSFIIPVVNFWWPYQSACDLFPAGHPARRLVGRWWALWIGMAVSGVLGFGSAVAAPSLTPVLVAGQIVLVVCAAVAARGVISAVVDVHTQLLGPEPVAG